LVALIVLVVMTLAGMALMRSVSTSNVIAGNMAFQQSATHAADAGIEAAVTFLQGSAESTLYTSVTSGAGVALGGGVASGGGVSYLAYRQDPARDQTWDNFWTQSIPASAINTLPTDAAGNTVAYVIHRLCNKEGKPDLVAACSSAPVGTSNDGNGKGGGVPHLFNPPRTYYRITTRVSGPRNSLSYVQVVISIERERLS
jgi:Tfp pilus assembly protein PilX